VRTAQGRRAVEHEVIGERPLAAFQLELNPHPRRDDDVHLVGVRRGGAAVGLDGDGGAGRAVEDTEDHVHLAGADGARRRASPGRGARQRRIQVCRVHGRLCRSIDALPAGRGRRLARGRCRGTCGRRRGRSHVAAQRGAAQRRPRRHPSTAPSVVILGSSAGTIGRMWRSLNGAAMSRISELSSTVFA